MTRFIASLFVVASTLSPPLAAQVRPDLVVQDVSVSSTLPLSDGQRLVGVSFRIQNAGKAFAARSTTRVTIGGIVTNLATPQLQASEVAFVTHSLRTGQAAAAISIQLDVSGGVPEVDEQNNTFQTTVQLARVEENRWLSIGPSTRPPGGPDLGVGRVTTLAIDPRSPTIVYAGARGSGLWIRECGSENRSWFSGFGSRARGAAHGRGRSLSTSGDARAGRTPCRPRRSAWHMRCVLPASDHDETNASF